MLVVLKLVIDDYNIREETDKYITLSQTVERRHQISLSRT